MDKRTFVEISEDLVKDLKNLYNSFLKENKSFEIFHLETISNEHYPSFILLLKSEWLPFDDYFNSIKIIVERIHAMVKKENIVHLDMVRLLPDETKIFYHNRTIAVFTDDNNGVRVRTRYVQNAGATAYGRG